MRTKASAFYPSGTDDSAPTAGLENESDESNSLFDGEIPLRFNASTFLIIAAFLIMLRVGYEILPD